MKTVLITGGSSGIGLEFVRLFLANDFKVIVASRSDTMPDLDDEFKNVVYFSQDLSKSSSAKELAQKLAAKKIKIDVLVNNAGFGDYGAFVESDIEKLTSMMQLNMNTLTELTHLLLPQILKSKGKILNVASTAAFAPGPYMNVYFATKHYVLAFSEALHEELKSSGVSVTALCPGPTKSQFSQNAQAGSASIFRGSLPTAQDVARFGYKALDQNQAVAIHGWKNRVQIFLLRLLPRAISRKALGSSLK